MTPDELLALCRLYEVQLAAVRDSLWRWRIATFVAVVLLCAR